MTSAPEEAGLVCRRRLGLNALAPAVMVATAVWLAASGPGSFMVFMCGAAVAFSAQDLWKLGETLTFREDRVQRRIPGKGRYTWWLDGRAVLLRADRGDGVLEWGRWALPVQRECLVLVYPGHEGMTMDDVTTEHDMLVLVPGRYGGDAQWARFLYESVAGGRLSADDASVQYLDGLCEKQ